MPLEGERIIVPEDIYPHTLFRNLWAILFLESLFATCIAEMADITMQAKRSMVCARRIPEVNLFWTSPRERPLSLF